MKTIERLLVWLLVTTQVSWAVPVQAANPAEPAKVADTSRDAATAVAPWDVPGEPEAVLAPQPTPPVSVRVNRTLPAVKPVPQSPVFSASPTVEEIFRARVFEEPLVPVRGTPTAAENQALAGAIRQYLAGGSGENTAPFLAFLEGHSVSVWRPSLQLGLGMTYRRTGYYSRAARSFEEAWAVAKGDTEPRGRAIADRALGELLQMSSRLGRQKRLGELIDEAGHREVGGTAGEMVEQAKQALWLIRQHPDRTLLCGPAGLDKILAFGNVAYKQDAQIRDFHAGAHGTTLRQMRDLANSVGLSFQMAKRADVRAELRAPALVHWDVGHFAALLKVEGNQLLVDDSAFGPAHWVSRKAFDEEASGFALVARGDLPRGWRPVPDAEAETVWGMGPTSQNDSESQSCNDHQSGGAGKICCPKAMARYSFHTMLVSLNVADAPVGYTAPRGPSVSFAVNYHQREVFQPQMFTYSNLGPKWTFGWLSYVQDDPTNGSQPATLYLRGGGQYTYSNYNSTTRAYDYNTKSRTQLVRTSDSPVTYERRDPDGSVEIYAQPDGAATFPRKVFLTRSVDPQGNAVQLTYDASLRLVAITDAISQVTSLSYEWPGDSLKVTKVTDPFGRYATFEYDASGRLSRITDVIGIASSFTYGSSDFMTALTTPYGTTTFRMAEEGRRRWIEATDPLNATERLEYVNSSAEAVQGAEQAVIPYAANVYPTGFYPGQASNEFYRNTFYWSKRAMALAPGKYAAAKMIHWLHTNGLTTTSGFIENEKEPLEANRTFYQYPNMAWEGTGSHPSPSAIGRVMEDGSSQIWRYAYNAIGKPIQAIDPVGRETDLVYGNNNTPDADPVNGTGIDLLQVKQKNGSGFDLLESFTYNPQHLPLTITDASGQTTTYAYNAQGQLLTTTTAARAGVAENRTTTYDYDSNGYLQSLTGPATGATTTYTYDGYGRVRTVTDPDAYTLTYDYDSFDRVTKVTYPDGTYEQTIYNRLDAERQQDRLGRWTQTFHDALRRPVAVRDAAGGVTQFQYGSGSGCSSCGGGGDRLTGLIDPRGNATNWEYDLQGRLTREVRANGSDATVAYETTSSRMKEIRDPKQQLIDIQYFLDDNWKQVSFSNTTVATPTVSLTYDSIYNRLATVTDGTGTTRYSYNPVTPAPNLGAGRLASVDGPLGNDVIAYTYDELGRMAGRTVNGVALSRTYDALGRTTSETNALGAFGYSYDGVTNRLSSVGYPNGQSVTLSYLGTSQDRRLQEIHNTLPGGVTLSRFQYAYAADGALTTWTQQTDSAPARAYDLGRDAINELTTATLRTTDPSPAVLKRYRYGYDHTANRTSEQIDDATSSASIDALNAIAALQPGGALRVAGTVNEPAMVTVQGNPAQVTGSNQFSGSAVASSGTSNVVVVATDPNGNARTNTYQVTQSGSAKSLTYDANGSLIADGTRTFEWDGATRLTAVNQGTHRSEFSYDGWGHRVRIIEKDNGVVTSDRRLLWCDMSICEERDSSGSIVTRRLFDQGMQEGGSAFFYTTDHLGSIRELTDATGAIRARYDYDPYGRVTKVSGDKSSLFTFEGYFAHDPSGLLLSPLRAYDPSVGRWISQDPIGLIGGLNAYAFVNGMPTDMTDPLGLFVGPLGPPPEVLGAIGGSLAAGAAQGGLWGTPVGPVGIAVGVVAGAVVGGAIGYWWWQNNPPPPPDPQNSAATGNGSGGSGSSAASTNTATTTTTTQQEQQRQRDYDAYKKRCNETPPSSCQTPCDVARFRLQRNIDCRRMRQEWDDRYQPGRHAKDIANLDRSIKNLDEWIRKHCK